MTLTGRWAPGSAGRTLQQMSNQVAEAPAFVVSPLLEPLREVPGERGEDPLRLAAEQISCCDSTNRAPTGLGE